MFSLQLSIPPFLFSSFDRRRALLKFFILQPTFLDVKPGFFKSPWSCFLEGFLGVNASGLVRLTPQSLTRCHILHRPGARSGVWGEKAGAATQETGMQVNYRGEARG